MDFHPSITTFLNSIDLPSSHPYMNLVEEKHDVSSIGTSSIVSTTETDSEDQQDNIRMENISSLLNYLPSSTKLVSFRTRVENNPSMIHNSLNYEQILLSPPPALQPNTCPKQNYVSSNEDYYSPTGAVLLMKQYIPPLIAALHLFFRLFAPLILISCLIYLTIITCLIHNNSNKRNNHRNNREDKTQFRVPQNRRVYLSQFASIMTMVCLLTIITDASYVQEYGRVPLLVLYVGVSLMIICLTSFTTKNSTGNNLKPILFFTVIALLMIKYCDMELPKIKPGLYYNKHNSVISSIIDKWPIEYRTYTSTPWVVNGDTRTGIPFFLSRVPKQTYVRRWVPINNNDSNRNDTESESGEAILVDIAFPSNGIHRTDKPIYLILCGLTGDGHNEEFVKDFVFRRREEGSTVVVMVARGLGDSNVIGNELLNFAKWSDIEAVATVVRQAVAPNQTFAGVGYSMGAIALANYVARSGHNCKMDAAVAISGALDTRQQLNFHRSRWLWQKLIVLNLRKILTTRYVKQLNNRFDREQIMNVASAQTMVSLDEEFFTKYHNYKNVEHYYSELGAMGDLGGYDGKDKIGRIANVAIPMLVVNALDDPIAFHQTMGNPVEVSKSGNGFTVMLLTQKGGHVGWPVGRLAFFHGSMVFLG